MIGCMKKIIAPPVEFRKVEGIWEIPSSMFFFDQQIPQSLLPRARIGLERTIKSKKIFHIWFHPWNLLLYYRMKSDLEEFLKYINKKIEWKKIEVLTMGDLAYLLNSQ